MVKYLIAETQEIDGHSYGAAHYIQLDGEPYTRAEKINVIQAIAMQAGATMFQEGSYGSKKEDDTQFFGKLVFQLEGHDYTFEENASYSFFKLPSRMKKNTIYTTEISTG